MTLPTKDKQRKQMPIATGCVDYFARALAYIAYVSYVASQQHNPGKPMMWDRTKSKDHANTAMRHFVERGKFDTDGLRHTGKYAWRALALLQQELEDAEKPRKRNRRK
jgi:hypothetical protein